MALGYICFLLYSLVCFFIVLLSGIIEESPKRWGGPDSEPNLALSSMFLEE